MRKMLVLLCFLYSLSSMHGDEVNACYALYTKSEKYMPIEKEFIVNLKPTNPDNPKSGGYAKFRVAILYNDKNVAKEIDSKLDIVRHVISNIVSGFLGSDLQSSQGRCKFSATATASINAILTDSSIDGLTFPDFVIQP